MSERRPTSPESKTSSEHRRNASPERSHSQENQSEHLKPQSEIEKSARKELENLHDSAEQSKPDSELFNEAENSQQTAHITKDDKRRAYSHTIKHVQSKLSKPAKRFSQLIHSPAVERASEAMEKSVARPSAVLGGAVFAFVGLSIMTFFARRYGFSLSGTELLLFVAAGWVLGLLIEFIWKKIIRRA